MNVELLLWIVVIGTIANAAAGILAGLAGVEKPAHYGAGEVFCGILVLVLMIVVIST